MRREAIVLFLGTLISTVLATYAIMEALNYFGYPMLRDKKAVALLAISFIALVAAVAALIYKRELILRDDDFEPGSENDYDGKKLSKVIISELQRLKLSQDFQTILRIGHPLSRTLWLEGQYKTRVEVGKAVEEAAAELNDKKAQCQALIDDIGWTLVVLGKEADAEKYISRGITIATESGHPEFAAKGHRHLAGIRLQKKTPQKALEHLKDAVLVAASMVQQTEKDDMLGNIEYLRASAYLASGDFVASKACLEKAKAFFKDESRAVKTYALYGKLAERQDDLLVAKDAFRDGLKEAKRLDRRDEIIRNTLGLSRIAKYEGDKREEKKLRNTAEKMMKTTPLPFEDTL